MKYSSPLSASSDPARTLYSRIVLVLGPNLWSIHQSIHSEHHSPCYHWVHLLIHVEALVPIADHVLQVEVDGQGRRLSAG